MKKNAFARNLLLLAAVVALAVFPLLFVKGDFGGADDAAESMIGRIHPGYEPWFSSFFELPGETESMLFALQAAIGAGIIGYAIGFLKGKSKASRAEDSGSASSGPPSAGGPSVGLPPVSPQSDCQTSGGSPYAGHRAADMRPEAAPEPGPLP
ncbi:hypothetical protein J19TS2_15780 [Cohnella xylanilytica]|nr:hypothetical protein J19TS2_15780 [Cohnella xylanilytica]